MRRRLVGFQVARLLREIAGVPDRPNWRQISRTPLPTQASSNIRRTVAALASIRIALPSFSLHSSQQGIIWRGALPVLTPSFRATHDAAIRSPLFLLS